MLIAGCALSGMDRADYSGKCGCGLPRTSQAEGVVAGRCAKRVCVSAPRVFFECGLLSAYEAEQMINDLCAEGCPSCKGPMLREGRFKCSCVNCGISLARIPLGENLN